MGQNPITTQPVTAISQTAARLSLAGAATFVVLLAALHLSNRSWIPPGISSASTRSAATAG